jgi:recombinational DNA repair protein (RecF pathway)
MAVADDPRCARCNRALDHIAYFIPAEVAPVYLQRPEAGFLCHRCPSDSERALILEALRESAEEELWLDEEALKSEALKSEFDEGGGYWWPLPPTT